MHPNDWPKLEKRPIDTAPKDGTVILGWWDSDPDPRPMCAFYDVQCSTWCTTDKDHIVHVCVSPTHWTPIT